MKILGFEGSPRKFENTEKAGKIGKKLVSKR